MAPISATCVVADKLSFRPRTQPLRASSPSRWSSLPGAWASFCRTSRSPDPQHQLAHLPLGQCPGMPPGPTGLRGRVLVMWDPVVRDRLPHGRVGDALPVRRPDSRIAINAAEPDPHRFIVFPAPQRAATHRAKAFRQAVFRLPAAHQLLPSRYPKRPGGGASRCGCRCSRPSLAPSAVTVGRLHQRLRHFITHALANTAAR